MTPGPVVRKTEDGMRRGSQPSAALRRSSPEPLYRQLAQVLERAIQSGALKPGDKMVLGVRTMFNDALEIHTRR